MTGGGATFRMTRGRRSERQWWKFRDTGVKIQDIHDDRVKVPGHRVKIQDIHDDRVKVPGHRGEDSGHSR